MSTVFQRQLIIYYRMHSGLSKLFIDDIALKKNIEQIDF